MLDYTNTRIVDLAGLDRTAARDRSQSGDRTIPPQLLPEELKPLYTDARRRAVARQGDRLVYRGELFRDLYAVCTGSFKAYINDLRGREQALGDFMPGDIIGFDAIETGRHRASFVALEKSEVLSIPFDTLHRLLRNNPGLLSDITERMSRKLAIV